MQCDFGVSTFKWEKYWCRETQDGKCLKLNDLWVDFYIEEETFSLVKQHLNPMDSGIYHCVFTQRSLSIDLQVLQNKNGLSVPGTVNVIPNENVSIACKYIQEYQKAQKSWTCYTETFLLNIGNAESVKDNQTRSELLLTLNVKKYNRILCICRVRTFSQYIEASVTLMVGLRAPQYVNCTEGDSVKIRCDYFKNCLSKFWCKVDSQGACGFILWSFNQNHLRMRMEDSTDFFNVIIEHLEMRDAGIYRCGCENYPQKNVTADVHLFIKGSQVPSQVSPTLAGQATDSTQSFSPSLVLHAIICLLTVIVITLLVILLKVYCTRSSKRVQDVNLGEDIFHMNDLSDSHPVNHNSHPCDSHPVNHNDIIPLQIYTPGAEDSEDSSSTSSDSSDDLFGNISFGTNFQRLSLKTSVNVEDYENVCDEKPAADYENVTTAKTQDYVNIADPDNAPNTTQQEAEASRLTASLAERITSNGSSNSSDESDSELVSYATVVLKKP
ncbi:uncharacterized protein LOC113589085 [Electrophorus electricus]|uniref:uncharacterized protein LOC113589085 n=1 Tax=Electrophorus electricus TaxID=8005 RepID=UPI0015CFBF2E|nr:uncharacterized protein LOC113589085 [Electrophorus electricus]